MNSKKILGPAVVLLLLVGIIVVRNVVSQQKPDEKSLQFFPGLTKEEISAFSMKDQSGKVTIRKQGDIWVVGEKNDKAGDSFQPGQDSATTDDNAGAWDFSGYPADSASVESALEKLAEMKRSELVSENPENQPTLEVDAEKGMEVEVWDSKNKSVGTFMIGKSAPDFSSHYVRMAGSNSVYTVTGSIRYKFFTDESRWRDKTILKFNKDNAQRIVLTKGSGDEIVLEKSVDTASNVTWHIAHDSGRIEAKKEKMDEFLDEISSLRCIEWETDSAQTGEFGFGEPELLITVELSNSEKKKLLIGSKKGETGKVWLKTDTKDFVFLVYESTIKKFDLGLEDLKAPPKEPTAEEGTAAGVSPETSSPS